jgi:hypothetical protein
MSNFLNLPRRQIIILSLTILTGIYITICCVFNLIPNKPLNTYIVGYSIFVPLFLLVFETLIDLNEKRIFLIWAGIGIVLLVIAILTKNSERFLIVRSPKFDPKSTINFLLHDHSTSSLKSLSFFLTAYWLLNKLSKKMTGNPVVNTYWQRTWYNSVAKRKITAYDVIANIMLFLIIALSAIF